MTWSQELKHNVTDIARLQKQLGLSDSETKQLQELCTHFPMSVTRYYLKLIDWSDPCDPIRRMCIPTFFETIKAGRLIPAAKRAHRMRGRAAQVPRKHADSDDQPLRHVLPPLLPKAAGRLFGRRNCKQLSQSN